MLWLIPLSLHGSDGGVIAAAEVHELLTKIHNILDSAVSKWVGNPACILAYPFNSAPRQHGKFGLHSFHFFNIEDLAPSSETCLYGCIRWSLAQA